MLRFEVIIYNIHPMQRKHQHHIYHQIFKHCITFLDLGGVLDLDDLDYDLDGEPFL